ncbi:MAG TPA: hypothetical protein VE961_27655 [Pyrinomonadaceae bacterium]|nr:hypothetical protein [Pyrinomonadaceae bacterium]
MGTKMIRVVMISLIASAVTTASRVPFAPMSAPSASAAGLKGDAAKFGYQTDPSIETFWTKFKSAVSKGEKDSVASMVQFPIGMPYGFRTIKTKPELIKRYRELFNVQANAAKCFVDAKPEVEATAKNQFTVGCKDAAGNETVIYRFVRTRGIWKLKGLDNINE